MSNVKMLAVLVSHNVKPTFEHDCSHCRFIAHIDGHDAYVCKTDLNSIVLRYGNDGPEYSSLPASVAPPHTMYALVVKLEKLYNDGIISRNKYYTRTYRPTFRPIRPQHLQADYN